MNGRLHVSCRPPGAGLRRLAAALVLLAALAPSAGSVGCAGSTATTSRIKQGQPVSTGNADYDAFFKQVLALREEAMRAEKDSSDSRASLVKVLELDPSASADAAVLSASERAKKLRDEKGVLMHLELTPEVRLVTVRPPKKVDAPAEALFVSVEETAKGSLALVRRMGDLSSRVAELQKKRVELRDKAAAAFGFNKDNVVYELNAAEQVLAEAAAKSSAHAGQTSQFLIALAGAVETGAGSKGTPVAVAAGRPKSPGKATPGKATPGKSAPSKAPSSGATGTAPPPKKPKPKKSDDFEP